jgi:hypothetical protein
VAKKINKMDPIKLLYHSNPEFAKDILHLHFFRTTSYYDSRMKDFLRLKISGDLKMAFFMIDYAESYSFENGKYVFKLKTRFLGLPYPIPFPLLFNELIQNAHDAADIENMFNKFYSSEKATLIRFAEQFKSKNIVISSELFDFIKRKECDPKHNWEINEIISGEWNYTLLTLNQRVWETAFDKTYLNNIFQREKVELDKIDAGKITSEEGYLNHLKRIDSIIHEKLM